MNEKRGNDGTPDEVEFADQWIGTGPDFVAIADLKLSAKKLADLGELDADTLEDLIEDLHPLVPRSRPDVYKRVEAELRSLLPKS